LEQFGHPLLLWIGQGNIGEADAVVKAGELVGGGTERVGLCRDCLEKFPGSERIRF
jgi:hypothetical protein